MKISFYQQTVTETETRYTEKNHISQGQAGCVGAQKTYFAEGRRDWIGMPGKQGEKGKSLIELKQEAANTNVAVQQDYMTLMSNTMSEEDYARLQEDGFDFGSMNPEEAVTIVDKIKAELIRSGKQIEGYTDDLDMDTLAAALGSQTLAQAVSDSFRAADVPLTEENINAVAKAWNMASELRPLTEGSTAYLIDNHMDGEIWNLYLAQNSGADRAGGTVPRFYAEDVQGYYARSAEQVQTEELPAQIEKILEQSGREVNSENRRQAVWLLEKGLPLTEENLDRLEELEKTELPVGEEQFAKSVAAAVAEGEDPVHGLIAGEKESLYEKAVRLVSYYRGDEIWEASAGDITARRQLEEIRFRMTAEVNVKLLKSGFSIDTAPMEELVEALKAAEQQLADSYFPEDAQAAQKYRTYCEVNAVAEEIPGLPARILGSFTLGFQESIGMPATLEAFYESGKTMQAAYARAGESYETLMTAPRSDMGDSIKKAFANVDDILRDLGQETSEENRRAARILGYNRMEMTVENLDRVKEADRQVKTVVEKLTPAATLKMIRDGVNPLEKSFEELELYFDSLPEEYRDRAESYSRFLYGLEQNKTVTEEERESYIGIYRLVRQIEKTEGAAVGALVNAQAELRFSNLLTAVRSGRFKSLDVRTTDDMGLLSELVRKGDNIPDQIGRAFLKQADNLLTEVSYSEKAEQGYRQMQLEQYRGAVVTADSETAAILNRGQLPTTAENLLAAEMLTREEKNLFAAADRKRETWRQQPKDGSTTASAFLKESQENISSTGLWGELEEKQKFQQDYRKMTDFAREAVEELSLAESETSIDVRGMQLIHKQLTVMSGLADKEEYFVPVYVGDMLTRVHLTFDRGGREKGTVHIGVRFGEEQSLEARFSMEKGELRGIFSGRTKEEVMKLEEIADTFKKEASNNWSVGDISIINTATRQQEGNAGGIGDENVDNTELYRVAKVFLHAVQSSP